MQLLKIRFYQLKRDLGLLFFVIIAALVALSYFFFQSNRQYGFYVVGSALYVLYSFHKARNDQAFIAKHFDAPQQQMALEYQLFLLPASVPCLFTGYYYCFFIMHAAALVIPFTTLKTNIRFKLPFLAKWFKNDFIFIAGIRKNFIVLTVLGALALLLSPLKLFPLVALFLFNAIIFTFYDTNESVQMLQSFGVTPKQYLAHFFKTGLTRLLLLNAPVLIINTVFNPDLFLFNGYFLGYHLLMLATVIAVKYSNYNHYRLYNNFQIKLMVMYMGLFTPYLFPLAVVFYMQSRTEAIKNLKRYLDDHY